MTLVAAPATVGDWVDTDQPLTASVCRALSAAGKVGVVRYCPLPANAPGWDVAAAELAVIAAAGLQSMLVQHVRRPLWDPAQHDGSADAVTAVQYASHCGYPPGCHLWLDLEGIGGSGPATAVFAAAWAAHVVATGYRAGCYVGYAVPLDADALYELPDLDQYWSDAGRREVATRGFAVVQHSPAVTIGGVQFDPDTLAPDKLGGVPMACSPDAPRP